MEERSFSGWWLTYPSEKYEFVSWDDEIPNIWEKMFQTTNQFLLANDSVWSWMGYHFLVH
jgi:hypothetical protein